MSMSTSAKAASGAYRDPILIVEDTVENQELLRALCRKLSIQCDIAENGAVALSMMEKREYAMFVVDLMMPVMDGRTFIGEHCCPIHFKIRNQVEFQSTCVALVERF